MSGGFDNPYGDNPDDFDSENVADSPSGDPSVDAEENSPAPIPTPTRPDSLPDQLSYEAPAAAPPSDSPRDGGNGSTTRYDFYPFYTEILTDETINHGLDYFWSHCNEYQPHNPFGLATSFGYYQNLAKATCLSHRH